MRYRVYDTTGEFATDAESGQAIYDLIHPCLQKGEVIELDFDGVDVFASAFFNFAVGQLLNDLDSETLNELLTFPHLSKDGKGVLKRVIANAKRYYGDLKYQEAVDGAIEEYAAGF